MNIAHTVCVRGSKGHVMTMSGSPKGVPRRSKGVLSRGGEKISGRPWAPILIANRTLKEWCCKRCSKGGVEGVPREYGEGPTVVRMGVEGVQRGSREGSIWGDP